MNVRPPYRAPDPSWLSREGSPLPEGFLWGAAVAGFQVEGGFNGPGLPENDWGAWERARRVAEPAGEAVRFWDDPGPLLDLAAGLSLNAFRTSLEWARLQPRRGADLDPAAVDGYAAILAGCRSRGLEPVVTLHHFTLPAHLGADFWLEDAAPEAFARYAEAAATAVNRALAERGVAPVTRWLTINEANILAHLAYLAGAFPHGARRSLRAFRRATDHLLAGHVLAYRAVHRAHAREGWPAPMVSWNPYARTAYALDRAMLDLGFGRAAGVARRALPDFLEAERPRWEAEVTGLLSPAGRALDRALERLLLPDPSADLPRYVDALYAGEAESTYDWIAVDLYTPAAADHVRMPFTGEWRDRSVPFVAELWETTIRPEALRMVLLAHHREERPLPIVVAENGMCTRVRGGMRRSRRDGWRRPAFIRAHVSELLLAAREGVPVAGYLHWSLVDNYEWGSYEPRFGLYGVDRRQGVRIMGTDADGDDAAGAYRAIVEAARANAPDRLVDALRPE